MITLIDTLLYSYPFTLDHRRHNKAMQSLMVYPNDNDFLHMSILDDNVTKQLIHSTDHHNNQHHMENYMTTSSTSASSSPIQDYLIAPPTYQHPQQQHPNQRQHQVQFPIVPVMPTMVAAAAVAAASHSAPSSPSYPIIKTEDVQAQQRMDYLMFPNFDIPSSATTTASSTSSTSPQMQQQRMMPYDASLIQQRHHHQQQQQQHAQQLRLQHQRALEQQQQQMMFDAAAPNHSTVSTMSIPTTNAMMSNMSANATVPTTTPFFHPSNIAYMPAAHPAAPKRKREESGQSLPRQTSPQLLDNTTTVMTTPSNTSSSNIDEPSWSASPSLVTLPKKISSPSSRPSTSSRLDKVKATRSTKVTKFASSSPTPSSSSIASTSTAALFSSPDMLASTSPAQESKATRASTKKSTSPSTKKAQSESRETSPISGDSSAAPQSSSPATGSGNITHPRRAAQNRAAQRTFRNRRKAYIKELEQKVQEMDQTRDLMDAIQRENQEVWRRLQVLEAMASQNGLQVPAFPALTPFASHLNANVSNNNGMMMTSHSSNPMMGSSNEEEEDEDEDMSDSYAHSAYPLLHQRQHPHQQL